MNTRNIILAAAASLVIVFAFSTGFSTLSLTSDLCVNSIDEISVSSNVLDFEGDDAFSITGVSGTCDNKIMGGGGTIPAEDMQAGQLQAQKDFTVGVTSMQQYMYHNIKDFKNPVYAPQYRILDTDDVRALTDPGLIIGDQDFYNACKKWQEQTRYSSVFDAPGTSTEVDDYRILTTTKTDMFCSRTVKKGVNSEYFTDSFSNFKAEITAETGSGASDTGTISKDDASTTLAISDVNGDGDTEKVRVTWTGSLLSSLRSADFSEEYRPVFSCTQVNCGGPNEISWDVGTERQYQNYVDRIRNYRSQVQKEISNGGTGKDTALSTQNTVSSLLQDNSGAILNDLGSWAASVKTVNGETRVYAADGRQVENPEFRFLIDTEWVAATVPVAKPVISESTVSDVTILSGDSTQIQFQVTNQAQVSATIQTGGSCSSSLVSIDSETLQFEPGETRTTTLNLGTSSVSENRSVTCNVFAQDTDDSTSRDSVAFTVNLKNRVADSDGDGVPDQFDACLGTESGVKVDSSGCKVIVEPGDGDDDTGTGWFAGFENPFTDLLDGITTGDTDSKPGALFYLDLFISFLAGTAVFGFARSTMADIAGITVTRNRLLFAAAVAVAGTFVVYQFISLWIVKIVVTAGLLVYGYLQSLIPGV